MASGDSKYIFSARNKLESPRRPRQLILSRSARTWRLLKPTRSAPLAHLEHTQSVISSWRYVRREATKRKRLVTFSVRRINGRSRFHSRVALKTNRGFPRTQPLARKDPPRSSARKNNHRINFPLPDLANFGSVISPLPFVQALVAATALE